MLDLMSVGENPAQMTPYTYQTIRGLTALRISYKSLRGSHQALGPYTA